MDSEFGNDLLTTLNSLDMGVVVVNKHLKIEFVNQGYYELWDIRDLDIGPGDDFRELIDFNRNSTVYDISDDDWEGYVSSRLEEISKGDTEPRELERVDGIHLLYSITKLADGRRLLTYFDFTAQIQREDELANAREEASLYRDRLTEALESIEDGFVVFDKEDRLVLHNNAYLALFGENADQIEVGKTFEEIMRDLIETGGIPVKDEDTETFLADLINKRHNDRSFEKIFQTNDGTWIRMQDRRTSSGNLVGLRTNVTELKNAEEKVLKNQELMHSVLQASENAFLVTDADDNVIQYNEHFADILLGNDVDLEKCENLRDIFSMLHSQKSIKPFHKLQVNLEEFLKVAYQMYQSAVDGEAPILYMVDGRFLRYRVRELDNSQIIHSYVDITEETVNYNKAKQREKEIKEASALLSDTTNDIDQGILVLGQENIEFFNPKAREILDLPDNILAVGQPWIKKYELRKERGDFGTGEQAEEHFNQIMAEITGRNSSKTFRDGLDGIKLMVTSSPNSIGGVTITYTDITEIRNREDELKEAKNELEIALAENEAQKERFKAFAEANSDWFWEMDHELRFCYFSQPFEQVTGVNPEVLLGKTREETGIPSVDQEVFDAHLKELRAYEPFRDFTHPRIQKDGSTIWLAISGNPVFDKDGKFTGYVGSGRDVTKQVKEKSELEQAKRAAESAERAKSEFLANMSHEIRTPMNGVMGMAELLAATELDSKQKMFTDVIVKSGASLLTIINDILDFSKIDAGQMELDPAPFSLPEAIEDVATLISAKVAEKDLEMIVRVNPALPEIVVGDVGRLRQIVTNMLGNAVKFTEKGHIYVNVDGTVLDNGTANLTFSVADTGIGIPEEKCAQIFQKFSQVDNSATRKHEGTGLGLSIASSLVKLMGGQIKVESEIGMGSRFWFDINLPIEANNEIKRHVIPGDLSGSRIMIIDDNPVNQSILMEQMTAWKFDSATAASGKEGLAILQAIKKQNISVDLVVLDYQMPDMTGADVLRHMRQECTELSDIPVLVLTSVDSAETNKELVKLGVEANLIKPTRSSLLLETILQIISNDRVRKDEGRFTDELCANGDGNKKLNDNGNPDLATDKENEPLDILIAEDNEVNQIVFTQILSQTRLNFKIVENGRLAVASFKHQSPKMVLMDVAMPEMNGKDATIAIRQIEKQAGSKRAPIIGVTAHALKGDMEACLEVGMDDYLSKPLSPAKLLRKIEQWLKVELSANSKTG
ncbi:MAG: PAS-domain containing protein [Pseudomonadota bacterium]